MAKSSAKLFIAAALGLAAGIGVGMLVAPAKGSKTRKRLKKKIMSIADSFEDDISEKLNAFKTAIAGDQEEEEPEEFSTGDRIVTETENK
jgi:gas vesicle protein